MKVSKRSISRILRDDLRLGAYRRFVGHLLDGRLRKIRLESCKILLKSFKKMSIVASCFRMKKSSLLKKNLIGKMIGCMREMNRSLIDSLFSV